MDFDKNIPKIEKIIGYTFKDKSLLRQAFTRTSFCNENWVRGKAAYQSNEVLEFFGDGILSAAIITILVEDMSERYEFGIKTELLEGDFSNIKSKLSDKKNLSERTGELGLHEFLLMGEGDTKLGIQNEPSVKEDLFESIIGAIYVDSDKKMAPVIKSVSKMLDVKSYLKAGEPVMQSYKNALQEYCQDKSRRLPAPEYKTVSESGPDHKKQYQRAVFIGDKQIAVGTGKNQKLADADAARLALIALAKEDEGHSTRRALDPDSVIKLRDYLKSHAMPPATFKDLGESEGTGRVPEYRVMCRVQGKECVGCAADKATARTKAACEMLRALKGESAESKTKPHPKPKSKSNPSAHKARPTLRKGRK